jgi:spermidine synthase
MTLTKTDTRAPERASRPSGAQGHWSLLVYLLFFLSGLTSLIYEVIWVREFGLVFGVTTYAVSTVLAAFFAGLAGGSYVAGRIIDRTKRHPLVVYGLMEGAVGLYALALPFVLKLVEAAYPAVYSQLGESFSLFTLFRFLASFVVLVIPTTLMGATLPVLSKLMVNQESELGLNVGRLYATNTFGAVAGSISAGYVLIAAYGVPATILIAAVGNFVLCGAALLMSRARAFRVSAAVEMEAGRRPPLARSDRLVLALAFTSGLAILALEVVWTKSLVLILGSTTYAFAAMLSSVLVGIAVGSAVFAGTADLSRNRGAAVATLVFLGGACAAAGPIIINQLPRVFLGLADWTGGSFELLLVCQFIVCFLLVFVPTFLSGASFPILVRMHSRGAGHVGSTVADVYSINTLGGILGSLLGGFVLVKFLGLANSMVVAALFLMAVGGLLAVSLASWRRSVRTAVGVLMVCAVVLVGVFHPQFDQKLIFGGWGVFGQGVGSTVDVTSRNMMKTLYHREGISASVDVLEQGDGMQFISINAQTVASTYMPDMRALQMLGHLPVLLHPDPKQVLIIGLGAGVSSGIIGSYPGVDQVTVVELNDEVPGGTAEFAEWNFGVLHNPKVKIVINDGANYVKATRKKYDFISSDPIHPFIAGNGTLYSEDHWKICRDRLNEGGVIAQWIPMYQLSPTDWATIIHTFTSVFPNSSMWYSGIDVVLIGFKGDVKVDPDRMAEKMAEPRIARDLLTMGIRSPGDVFGWFIAGPEELQEMGAAAPINRVDRPVLEYTAPRAIALEGVASTMPALLTAYARLTSGDPRAELNRLCTRPLTAQELFDASTNQIAQEWVMRAMLLDSDGRAESYLRAMERAKALRPHDLFISVALSEAQGRYAGACYDDSLEKALYLYQLAIENDPTNVEAIIGAMQAAMDLGDYAMVRGVLAGTPPRQREVFKVLIYEALLAMHDGDYEGARRAYEAAAEHGQESPPMHIGLGILELREGNREQAHRHFRRALQVATNYQGTLYDLVTSCETHGQRAEGREYAQALVASSTGMIASNPTAPLCYEERARAYEALGESALAERDWATARSLKNWWETSSPTPITLPGA